MWGLVTEGSIALMLLGPCGVKTEYTMHPQSIARMEIPVHRYNEKVPLWQGDPPTSFMLKWRLPSCFLSTHTRCSNFPLPEGGGKKNAQNVPSVPGPDGELFYRFSSSAKHLFSPPLW